MMRTTYPTIGKTMTDDGEDIADLSFLVVVVVRNGNE